MNTIMKPAIWTAFTMLSLSAGVTGTSANAFEHGYRSWEPPVSYEPVYEPVVYSSNRTENIIERKWVEGHYEIKCETILVAPEHREVRVIPPVLETRRDYFGHSYTVMITPERREEICVPAKYEKVENRVWIPGYFKDVAVQVPVCPPPSPPIYSPNPAPVVYETEHHHHHRHFFDAFFRY